MSASGIVERTQVAPPSSVRITVPPVPLAQTTRGDTALSPRSRAVTPVGTDVQGDGWEWRSPGTASQTSRPATASETSRHAFGGSAASARSDRAASSIVTAV